MPRRILTAICSVGSVLFAALQFVRPAISHPPVTADLAVPPEVKQILKTSCYDCHSNETKLAWFDEIVPAYWLVANDVKEGRRHLNFSDIGKLPPGQQKGMLFEAVNQIQLGAMPLAAYTRLHRDARVSPAQLSVLKSYLNPPLAVAAATGTDLAADNAQYEQWTHESSAAASVAPALNGIAFPSGYKNWKVLSATDRPDNQTLRVILGNETAIQAVAENRTNPWPDGATFAKVARLARDDGQGRVRAGSFFQVEFMIRDRVKYQSTKGWGWARWRGMGLTPYGKDADFSSECVGCHTPVSDSDYVFTVPLHGQQLPANLPESPLQWGVITSAVDHTTSSMSTLFGNDLAVRSARCGPEAYAAGSVLALVTWTQREDERWFGAKIPGQVKSVEIVRVTGGPANQPAYSYERYEGSPLKKTSESAGGTPASPVASIISLRAAVMP